MQLVFFAALIVLIGYACWGGRYFVAEPDECTYYNSARLFNEAGSISAPIAVNEDVSPIGQCNWYGPMYPLLYGLITKVFGFHVYNFLVLNILCFLGAILVIYRSNFELQTKLLISTAFLSCYVFVVYIFQFYPEPLHLFFDTILILKLKKIYDKDLQGKPYSTDIGVYVLLILFFSLFRVTTVLWVFGLLAFAVTKKDWIRIASICIGVLFIVIMYMHYFNAPYVAGIIPDLMHDGISFHNIALAIKTSFGNIYSFATNSNSFYDLLYVLLMVLALYNYVVTKNKLVLSACIISALSLLGLLVFYVPLSSFLNKQTAYFYPLLIVPLFYTGITNIKRLTIAILLLFAPITYLKAAAQIKLRKDNYTVNEKLSLLNTQVEQIKDKIEPGKPRHVLMVLDDINYAPLIYLYTHLPFSTTDKLPITYVVNKITRYPMDEMQYKDAFKTHGKLYNDYFLSRNPLIIDSTTLVYQTTIFCLYKNNKRVK